MKRLLLWIAPLLVAIPVFVGTVAYLNQKTGNGALQVTSIPDSSVYLDGKLIGKTPLCKCETQDMIAVGDHVVKLVPSSGDFMPFEGKITIYKSVLTVLDRTFGNGASSQGSVITLTPIDDKNAAQFFAISFPDKAQVLLDGSPAGETTLLLPNITASDHELIFKKEGYNEKVIRVRAARGYKLSATVYLGISDTIASSSAIASPSAVPSVATVLILNTPTGFLNVRSAASLSGLILEQVNPGDSFELVSEQTGWYQIKLTSGEMGWISSQYASKE
ncbi:MAG: PEGA domain-containing protein, partial [Candidatus Levyibacteriota bacterium]